MPQKIDIQGYSECACGAITIWLYPTGTNSVKRANLSLFNINLDSLKLNATSRTCNHCINNYGLDLCKCGSGKSPEDCCGIPCETLGKPVSFYEAIRNFRN